jgi:hypothetical protein
MLLSFCFLTRRVGYLSHGGPHLEAMFLLCFTTLVLSLGFRLLLKVTLGSKLQLASLLLS